MKEIQDLALKAVRYHLRNDMTNVGLLKVVAYDNHDDVQKVILTPLDNERITFEVTISNVIIIVEEYHRVAVKAISLSDLT